MIIESGVVLVTPLISFSLTGMIAASELKSGVKGQTYIDEQGDVRTDTGEKVEDIEKKSKIIDLQEKRG